MVFGLIAYDALAPPEAKTVLGVASLTVALSVVLHGVTSSPFARRYGDALAARRVAGYPEHTSADAVPSRGVAARRRGVSR